MKFLKSLFLFALFFYVINVGSMAFQIFVLGQDDYKFGPEGTFQIGLMVLGVFGVIAILIYSACYFIFNQLQKPIQLRQQNDHRAGNDRLTILLFYVPEL